MNPEEVKALLMDVVSNFIKDEPDAAKKNFHDALTGKARDRVNPPAVETEEEAANRIAAEEAETEAEAAEVEAAEAAAAEAASAAT